MKPTELTEQNFEQEVIKADLPVLVDFWAGWCGPCHIIAPHLEELAGKYEGKIKIAKLNIDEHPSPAQSHNVMSLPTLKFFKDGQVVDEIIGAVPKEAIDQKIQENL